MFLVVEAANNTGHDVGAVYGPYATRSDAEKCAATLARRDVEAGNDPREFFAQICKLPDAEGEYALVALDDDEDAFPPFIVLGLFATSEVAQASAEGYCEVVKVEML